MRRRSCPNLGMRRTDGLDAQQTHCGENGAEVLLPGFGKFKVKATPEREGRNPANGEKIKIAASKKLTFSSATF